MLIHACCVSCDGTGVLLRGPSGAGKSDLALRLIDLGADLVADDQVELRCHDDRLLAGPPPSLAGLLEVRGLGILRFPYRAEVELGLVVDLVDDDDVERLPEPAATVLLGRSLPCHRLSARPASAPNKVRLAVRQISGSIMTVS
jgi:serine kinase of HPr protein (carbohydrate metabolism regulator)